MNYTRELAVENETRGQHHTADVFAIIEGRYKIDDSVVTR